jgi:DNA gyrase subunit A
VTEIENNNQGVIAVKIEDEMRSSYLDYAMSVIVARAIPDVRDGLKPIHRRILYSMHESGHYDDKPYKKCARIVGDVMGKYHPHGNLAVYDSLVRMAQDFSLRVPLIDGQGNFGSIDGDSAAADRYTEARLAKVAGTMLVDLDKDTVEFQNNYDGTEQEPKVLPARFPNLLVNGSTGIAVGMATNIPSHNLVEIIDGTCSYIDNPNITIEELLEIIPGPDFPTGAMIMGREGIKSAYHTGRGSITIRGVAHIETEKNKEQIVITEIPYMVNKAKMIEKIAELAKEKKIEGITDLRDESNKKGIRVVIEVRKDVQADVILNQLYIYTSLQTSFGIIMLALDHGLPRVMNLKEILSIFVESREEVIKKRTIYLLNKTRDRAHLLLGIIIAVANIDEVIAIIKAAKDPSEAKINLMNKSWEASHIIDLIKLVDDTENLREDGLCSFTEAQAKAILEMRLQRLTAMEKNKIEEDLISLAKEIKDYLEILGSREKLLEVLKTELLEVREKFGTKRLTEISEFGLDQDIEDLIQREDMVVTYTLGGYIKRVPLSTYRSQNRGGKGRSGLSMRSEDITSEIFVGSTHTPLLFFSNTGQVYSLKLYKLPLGNPQGKGRPIINLLPLAKNESITTIMPLPEDISSWDDLNIVFATKKGNVRKNSLLDFKKIQSNGKIAIRLDSDDALVSVSLCNNNDHVFLATTKGKSIRFPSTSLRVFKSRTSDGVRGMKLVKDDYVIAMTILHGVESSIEEREEFLGISVKDRINIAKDLKQVDLLPNDSALNAQKALEMAKSEEFILSISSKGYGKISSAYTYRITNRGGSGIINMTVSNKTGQVINAIQVSPEDQIMLITDAGRLIRCKLDDVRVTGRSTQGVILFKAPENEKVVSCAIIRDEESEEEIDNS